MKWIRVNARLADDPQVRRFAVALLGEHFGPRQAVAATCGLLVALWGQIAELAPDGDVSQIDDDQLEAWARWWGEPGTFAKAWRSEFTSRGQVQDWEEYNGAAIRRLSEDAERKRRSRSSDRPPPRPAERPRTHPLTALRTPVRTSSVDGDGNGNEQHSGVEESEGGTLSTSTVEKPASAPLAVAASTLNRTIPSGMVVRFMARFYGRSTTPERRADVTAQMSDAILHKGVQFKGNLVRAVDEEHLDDVCREVMEEPPRDPNAAWVFVLQKLQDTYLETLSARTKALEVPRARIPEGLGGDAPIGATPLRAALANVLDGLEEGST